MDLHPSSVSPLWAVPTLGGLRGTGLRGGGEDETEGSSSTVGETDPSGSSVYEGESEESSEEGETEFLSLQVFLSTNSLLCRSHQEVQKGRLFVVTDGQIMTTLTLDVVGSEPFLNHLPPSHPYPTYPLQSIHDPSQVTICHPLDPQ